MFNVAAFYWLIYVKLFGAWRICYPVKLPVREMKRRVLSKKNSNNSYGEKYGFGSNLLNQQGIKFVLLRKIWRSCQGGDNRWEVAQNKQHYDIQTNPKSLCWTTKLKFQPKIN